LSDRKAGNGSLDVTMLDLIVTVPHLIALVVVVSWLLKARRLEEDDPSSGADESGGKHTEPPIPQLPLIGQGRHDDLARSA